MLRAAADLQVRRFFEAPRVVLPVVSDALAAYWHRREHCQWLWQGPAGITFA